MRQLPIINRRPLPMRPLPIPNRNFSKAINGNLKFQKPNIPFTQRIKAELMRQTPLKADITNVPRIRNMQELRANLSAPMSSFNKPIPPMEAVMRRYNGNGRQIRLRY